MASFSVTLTVDDGLTCIVEAELDQNAYAPDVISDLGSRAVTIYVDALAAMRAAQPEQTD